MNAKQKEMLTPSDSAFNKLYFVNLISGHKFDTFFHAQLLHNTAAKIASKLPDKELDYLIKHIESIL